VEKTPFSVLDLPPDAGVDAARSRYRQLAREHHPDTASDADKNAATRAMAELNWAMEELEHDADRWRARIGSPREVIDTPGVSKKPITVAPTLVLLNQENGFTAYVTAAAPEIDASAVRLRYASEVIVVERLPSFGGVANFRVSLSDDVRCLDAPLRERLEVRARGCKAAEVSVAVEAFEALEAPNEDEDEPPGGGHNLIEIAGWAAAAAGAAALIILAA
jgi:hypothetical protein